MARSLMRRVAFLTLALTGLAAEGAEVTVCIVDNSVPNNPVYFYLPTTGTVLRCEINRADYHPTLNDLYVDGWRLITVLDPKVKTKPGNTNDRPSPVFYLERSGGATAPQEKSGAPSPGTTSSDRNIFKGIF